MKEEALKLEKATKVAEKAVLKLAEILKNNDVLKVRRVGRTASVAVV